MKKPYRLNQNSLCTRQQGTITDLQPTVSNVTDVLLFLEILGYDNTTLPAPDFTSISDFANHVYEVIGYFDEERISETELRTKQFESEVPSLSKRLVDGASLISPWIGVSHYFI